MTKETGKIISRRHFAGQAATAAAAVTLVGATVAVAAQMSAKAKEDLSKLSNVLFNSPQERKVFLGNPTAYADKLGLKAISAADLNNVRGLLADGWCCGGCAC